MILTLSPVLSDEKTVISAQGDKLTVNGVLFDFTQLAKGETLPAAAINSPLICGDVTRTSGKINVAVRFGHAQDASEAARFPQPINVLANGPVELPQ